VTPLDQLRVWTARPDWMGNAECHGLTDLFFPEQGGHTDEAKAVCAACPVRLQCAEAGRDEHYGIWGGNSGRTRRHHRTITSGSPRALPPINHGSDSGYHQHLRRYETACPACRQAHSIATQAGKKAS
jgi:WhiB family redox-sensing transcriptional regulator